MSDKLNRIFETDDLGLLDMPHRARVQSSSDRLEESFLEVNDFYNEHGREPSSRTTDVSERRLGSRLLSMKADDEKVALLQHLDTNGLLRPEDPPESMKDLFSDDDLGLFDDPTGILTIKNVPTDVKKPDFIARPHPSKEFHLFEEDFKVIHAGLKESEFIRVRISSESQIKVGRYYVLKGLLTFVAWMDEKFESKAKTNARLRLIYENGTESNILLRSFAREIYRNGQRVVPKDYASLSEWNDIGDDDQQSGYIYVLSSLSTDDKIRDIENLYKIGFSTGAVERRVQGAEMDPTYLMAPVKIVSTYKCLNLDAQKLEHVIHRVFSDVKLDMQLYKSDGVLYKPSEWYVVPIDVIDRAVNMILNGEIVNYTYDRELRDLIPSDAH